jgi:predicted lipoprotein with Yx(FWY)xxD motif
MGPQRRFRLAWLRVPAGVAAVAVVGLMLAATGAVASAAGTRGPFTPGTSCATPVAAAPSGPAVVAGASTPYGRVLVVGSGANAGCSLYDLTSDEPQATPASFACPGFCATNVWPALLTDGPPQAGPGVNPTLLGTVARSDVLPGQTVEQVTYAGHPLYQFFVDTGPGQTNGADLFDYRTAPPGVWYLVLPSRGLPAPGTASLSPETVTVTATSSTETVLSVLTNSDFGYKQFPVYTFSADTEHQSSCTGECAVIWPPLLTTGRPLATGGVDQHGLGIIVRPDGSHQVTWDGQPLYLFRGDAGTPGTAHGQGLGAQFGGTGFHLVPLP